MADQTIKVNITANGEDLKREIESEITALGRFASAANSANKTAVSAVRESISAQSELLRSLGATETQFNKLKDINDKFEQRVQAGGVKNARAFQSMARGLSVIETQSHANIRSIDQVIGAASNLAFSFGTGGILFGAVLMVGAAMVKAFEDAAHAVERLRKKTEMEFQTLGESLSASAAAQAFQKAQAAVDAQQAIVNKLKKDFAPRADGKETLAAAWDRMKSPLHDPLKTAQASLVELNREADKFYAIWQGLDRLKPMKEVTKESKAAEKEMEKLRKLTAKYVAEFGGDALENKFLKKNQKITFSPGADITKDALKIEAPKLDKEAFRRDILTPLDEWTKSLTKVSEAHRILQGVSTSVFQGMLAAMNGMGSGVKAMEKAILTPIVHWLEATAIKEFVLGMEALANPFLAGFIATAHFKTAAEATAGAALVSALGGIGGGGGGKSGGGGGGGGGSGSNAATSLGAGSSASQGPLKMEIVFVQKTPDGREISRLRQQFQRQTDLAQPIRVVM